MPEDRRLTRLTKICLAFPGATREYNGEHATFRVKKRPFAYFLADHHGDGIVAVCCKVAPGANTEMKAAEPDRYYIPAYIGPRGWVGYRLDTAKIDWAEVTELVTHSHRRVTS
jgi:predicted DNA-binding protein (MmcQ/YjbR family)